MTDLLTADASARTDRYEDMHLSSTLLSVCCIFLCCSFCFINLSLSSFSLSRWTSSLVDSLSCFIWSRGKHCAGFPQMSPPAVLMHVSPPAGYLCQPPSSSSSFFQDFNWFLFLFPALPLGGSHGWFLGPLLWSLSYPLVFPEVHSRQDKKWISFWGSSLSYEVVQVPKDPYRSICALSCRVCPGHFCWWAAASKGIQELSLQSLISFLYFYYDVRVLWSIKYHRFWTKF